MEMQSPDEKADTCRACRMDKTYQTSLKRITISIPDKNIRSAILNSLEQLGGERKSGRAPKGNMERELQTFIDAMLGHTD